jgi:hypothetical protein
MNGEKRWTNNPNSPRSTDLPRLAGHYDCPLVANGDEGEAVAEPG